MGVLGSHTLGGIDEQHGHVAALDGTEGAQYRVFLDALLDTASTTNASSINQGHGLAIDDNRGIDGITGRSRKTRDDSAFGAEQAVQQARLSNVRPSDNGDA